jgi:molybdenum transport protein
MPFLVPDHELVRFAEDDAPYGDLTTSGLGIGDAPGTAVATAAGDMVVCCVEEAERLFQLGGCRVERAARSGAKVTKGTLLLTAYGTARDLHRVWKVAQTLMEITSGITSRAAAIVAATQAVRPGVAVACTRKHMPGTKRIALKAIMAGGAVPHRLGLSDSIMVFKEHRAFLASGISYRDAVAHLRAHAPERRVAMEADTEEEALAFAEAGADTVQVDKASPEMIARIAAAFARMTSRPILAAAGGINETNAAAYAEAGADLLVTSAPYTAPPRDVVVRMRRTD